MPIRSLATALLLTASTPALAQNLDPLTQALDALPAAVLATPAPVQAFFVDTAVLHLLADQHGEPVSAQTLSRAKLAAMVPPLSVLFGGNLDQWDGHAGIDLADISYFIGYGEVPATVTLWGLRDAAAATALIDTIAARDFSPTGADGVLGNGEPLALDLSNRDPSNPWRGDLGTATFVAAKGNVIVQSSTPDALPAVLSATSGVAANPIVEAALHGLDSAIGDHRIVQAMLISPTMGLEALEPASLLQSGEANFDAMRAEIEAQMSAGMTGIPPYLGGLIVDAQSDHPAVAIALTYTDCDSAQTAADLVAQRWTDTMLETAQGRTATSAIAMPDGLCAAVFSVTSASTDYTTNPIFDAVFDAYLRRSFTVLQIGAPA